jgi:hypothetical protein
MNPERIVSLTIGIAAPGERMDGTPLKESDWTDVARALGKASPEAADLLRGLYLHDARCMRRVFGRLREGYKLAGVPPKLADECARVTVGAFLAMRPCEHCEGSGLVRLPATMRLDIDTGEWVTVEAGYKQCSWCGGDGATHVQASVAGDALHVSRQVWQGLIAGPYEAAYALLRRWHGLGMSAVMATR